jgi:hypothetical protein
VKGPHESGGFSGVDLLLVDEASRADDHLYFAARSMLAVSGGALMMLSTPAGRRGVFHGSSMRPPVRPTFAK